MVQCDVRYPAGLVLGVFAVSANNGCHTFLIAASVSGSRLARCLSHGGQHAGKRPIQPCSFTAFSM